MSNVHDTINNAQEGLGDLRDTTSEKQELVGYPKLAKLMSDASETAIFRSFKELNMMNLLRLQAELHDMEHQLQDIRDEDAQSGDPVRVSYALDFRSMRDWKETGDSLQYDLLESIGAKLEQYSLDPLHILDHLPKNANKLSDAALSQALELSNAQTPTRRELEFLRRWLMRPSMGGSFLKDIEQSIWDEPNTADLVTLFPRTLQRDWFTSLLDGYLLDIYHRIWGHRRKVSRLDCKMCLDEFAHRYGIQNPSTPFPETGIRQYDDARIKRISSSVGAILSSLLPTVAILALYFVQRTLLRIGLTIIFTSVFSLALSWFTDARKVEIFSATAA